MSDGTFLSGGHVSYSASSRLDDSAALSMWTSSMLSKQ